MWNSTTRRQQSRAGLRYETDLTGGEWAVIAPLLPEPGACGRRTLWLMRENLNGIFYVLRGCIAWLLLPTDLPPKSTVSRVDHETRRYSPVLERYRLSKRA